MVSGTRSLCVGYLLSLLSPHVYGDNPINPSFPYGKSKVRGVNLGGWLVLEPWITPSLFDNTGNANIIDEWSFGQLQPRDVALNTLRRHWDTWITEKDFRHNGTRTRRTAVLKKIAVLFKNEQDIVSAIAPLNEPAGYKDPAILTVARQYAYDAYGIVRFPDATPAQSNYLVVHHDAFQPGSYWSGFQTAPARQGVAWDTHRYQMFTNSLVARTDQQHIDGACNEAGPIAQYDLWTIVGEWTPAGTDCAKYLNGRGNGARYDGTLSGSPRIGSCTGKSGKAAGFSASYKTFLRKYWEAQAQTYEKAGQGWIQWTWKTEQADDWSYQAGIAGGWIPKPPAAYQYPNICG